MLPSSGRRVFEYSNAVLEDSPPWGQHLLSLALSLSLTLWLQVHREIVTLALCRQNWEPTHCYIVTLYFQKFLNMLWTTGDVVLFIDSKVYSLYVGRGLAAAMSGLDIKFSSVMLGVFSLFFRFECLLCSYRLVDETWLQWLRHCRDLKSIETFVRFIRNYNAYVTLIRHVLSTEVCVRVSRWLTFHRFVDRQQS